MQLTETQRALVFWGGCMPTRFYLALVVARRSKYKDALRVFAAVIAARWLSGSITKATGFFGGAAWWADERAIHGALWGAYALAGDWRFLAADATLGGANWLAR